MTAEDKLNPPQRRPILLSPWLVIVGACLLYGLTLNHWVSLKALPLMAQVIGWDWHPYPLKWRPEEMAPLFLVLTAPMRLLPTAWQPASLNIFSALCAALTLGLLARSVHLMPHDRTREQRLREMGAHALLSIRTAFLPALFAVLVLATQLTFWENAVATTGEMLNLMVFAFIINCLLEYRISQNDTWLTVSALVYGLGDTNNWALLGFFPVYLFVLVWIRGLVGFFNLRFLGRMALWGLVGNLVFLLIPFLGATGNGRDSFGSQFAYLLGNEVGAQAFGLKLVPGWLALLAGVPSLLPLLFAGIKWPSFEGEISAVGNKLTRFMFSALHVACLALALVTFFDFKYSPSVRMREQPVSFLTFYYVGALCVGYFSGYMLLVFANIRLPAWERRHPFAKVLNFTLVAAVWVVAFAAPALLVWQNFPHIQAGNHGLEQFADQTLAALPSKPAVILSDDASRLYLLQAAYERHGLRNNNIMVDTESFPHKEYVLYLAAHHPELKSIMTTNLARLPSVLAPGNLLHFMQYVSVHYPVYYLHPSFGYYFEGLYLKPSGLIYQLKAYTTNMTQPPLVTEAEVQANQNFWMKMENGPLPNLPKLAGLDSDDMAVSVDYSVALDYWGTELQKAGYFKEAHGQFAEAVRLNTNNLIAAINLQYNEHLQKNDHRAVEGAVDTVGRAARLYGLDAVLRNSGPPDEPDLDLELGGIFASRGNLGQAILLFKRRLQFLPGDPEAELAMAKSYVDARQPDKAMELIHKLRGSSKINPWSLDRCEAMADIASGDYAAAERMLNAAIKAGPNDDNRVATLVEYYRFRGFENLRARKPKEAARYFSDALTNIDLQLKLLNSPNHDSLGVPDTLIKKAELEVLLQSYNAASATLSQVLQIQPKNYTAFLNRALSEIQIKQFQAAKDDFKEMGKLLPHQAYLEEFGLAEVADAEKNKLEEIDHLKRCIHLAPEESSEYQRATNRLRELEAH